VTAVAPKPSGRYPVAPKTQAAGLGGLSGASVGAAVIGLIEQYGTHAALPSAAQTAIYLVASALVAFAAAYTAPHQERIPGPAAPRVPRRARGHAVPPASGPPMDRLPPSAAETAGPEPAADPAG